MAAVAAERGWYVFPTRPNGKEPREGLHWPKVATCDPVIVARASWRPGEGYGVSAKLSGLVILDLDRRKPGYALPPDWQAEQGLRDGADVLAVLAERAGQDWPATFTVRTPSGGQHLYFRAIPGRIIGNRPAGPMIDVRAAGGTDGGYVVGPGSVIGGQAYEITDDRDPQPLPAWIADILDPPPVTRPADRVWLATPIRGAGYNRMVKVLDGLAAAGPGQHRNRHLHWAACRFAEMIGEGELDAATAEAVLFRAAEMNGHVEKHGDRATRRTIASGLRQSVAA